MEVNGMLNGAAEEVPGHRMLHHGDAMNARMS